MDGLLRKQSSAMLNGVDRNRQAYARCSVNFWFVHRVPVVSELLGNDLFDAPL